MPGIASTNPPIKNAENGNDLLLIPIKTALAIPQTILPLIIEITRERYRNPIFFLLKMLYIIAITKP